MRLFLSRRYVVDAKLTLPKARAAAPLPSSATRKAGASGTLSRQHREQCHATLAEAGGLSGLGHWRRKCIRGRMKDGSAAGEVRGLPWCYVKLLRNYERGMRWPVSPST
jgi:hypothetical protein